MPAELDRFDHRRMQPARQHLLENAQGLRAEPYDAHFAGVFRKQLPGCVRPGALEYAAIAEFLERERTPENYWRAVILFGQNVASYKFALAKTLIELSARDNEHVKLQELAEPKIRAGPHPSLCRADLPALSQ